MCVSVSMLCMCVCVCVCVCLCVCVCVCVCVYSHHGVLPSVASGPSNHHPAPLASHAAGPPKPLPHERAHPHAPPPPDTELRPNAGGQSAPGADAAGARVRHHLHPLRVPLHPHALHTGVPHGHQRSIRYTSHCLSFLSVSKTMYLIMLRKFEHIHTCVHTYSPLWLIDCFLLFCRYGFPNQRLGNSNTLFTWTGSQNPPSITPHPNVSLAPIG